MYVVLVNTNGWRDTLECLESVLRSDHPDVRVIVCDNASRDESVDRIRQWAAGQLEAPVASPGLRHLSLPPVSKPVPTAVRSRAEIESGSSIDWRSDRLLVIECGANLGFTGANNLAIRYALTQERDAYVWVLNNDTVVAPNALGAMMATAAAHANLGAVGSTLLRYHDPEKLETLGGATVERWHGMSKMIGAGRSRSARRDLPGGRMDFISGCSMLVPRETFQRVGLLDERFFIYCEDADLCLRMRDAGLPLRYCAEAEVWHKGGATAVHHSSFHDYHNAKSLLHFVRKHRPRMLPIAAAYLAVIFFTRKIARGQWARVRSVWRGFTDFRAEVRRPGHPAARTYGTRQARAT